MKFLKIYISLIAVVYQLLSLVSSQNQNFSLSYLTDPFDSLNLEEVKLDSSVDLNNNLPEFTSLSVQNENRRIVHGRIADRPEQYKFLISIAHSKVPGLKLCGGTLINPYTAISASHCNQTFGLEGYIAFNQVYDFSDPEQLKTGKKYEIIEFVQHPEYDPEQYINDIAIMRLDKPAILDEYIAIDDGTISNDFLHKVRVVGWGTTKFGLEEPSDVLRLADIQIFDNAICRFYMKMLLNVTVSPVAHICAMQIGGQADSCQGDSGGPLLARVCGKWKFVGVVSFGHKCGLATSPGMYTNVSHFLDWIRNNSYHS